MSLASDTAAAGRPEVAVDPRVTFANERTLLAWNRTALALVGGGLAIAELIHSLGALLSALPLMALGAFLAFASYRRWRAIESALRAGEPLPVSALPRTLAGAVIVIAESRQGRSRFGGSDRR